MLERELKKFGNVFVLSMLNILVFLSISIILIVFEDTEKVTLQRELAYLKEIYDEVKKELKPQLKELQVSRKKLAVPLSAYSKESIANTQKITVTGKAAKSASLLCINWDNEIELKWIIRNMAFTFDSLKDTDFKNLTAQSLKYTCYLIRLPLDEALSLEQNLDSIWKLFKITPNLRGDPKVFSKLAKAVEKIEKLNEFRQMSHKKFTQMIDGLYAYNLKNKIGKYELEDGAYVKLASTYKHFDENESKVSIPVLGVSIQTTFSHYVISPLILFLIYIALSLWKQLEKEAGRNKRSVSISGLLSIDGNHHVFDVIVQLTFALLVLAALVQLLLKSMYSGIFAIGINIVCVLLFPIIWIFIVIRKPVEKEFRDNWQHKKNLFR